VNTRAIINYLNVNKNVDTYNTRKVKVFPCAIKVSRAQHSAIILKLPIASWCFVSAYQRRRPAVCWHLLVSPSVLRVAECYPSMAGAGAVPCVHDGTGNASSNGTASSGSGLC
jgi:hypothetical protein